MHPRYSPRTIQDISKASPVQEDVLQDLTIDEPKANGTKTNDKQKQTPKTTTYSKRTTSSTSGNKRNKCDTKVIKDLFQKVFKTVTLTMGSTTACLLRATSLNREQATQITRRLEDAVHVASRARIVVLKAIEHYLYIKVTESPVEESHPVSVEFDPLDLILDKTHGTTIVRNLLSLVMSGGTEKDTGATAQASGAIAAKAIAKNIYNALCMAVPDLEPVNPAKIPLSVARMEMATDLHSDIRTHFRKLPELIVNKVIMIS
jgi:hypothetical protein